MEYTRDEVHKLVSHTRQGPIKLDDVFSSEAPQAILVE